MKSRKKSSPTVRELAGKVVQLNGNGAKYRTSIVFSPAIGENLELFAFKTRRSKNDIIEEALSRLLKENGYDPSQLPKVKIEFSY